MIGPEYPSSVVEQVSARRQRLLKVARLASPSRDVAFGLKNIGVVSTKNASRSGSIPV